MYNNINKYFLYEGDILRAAQYTISGAMKFYKKGYLVYYGNPEIHTLDITKVIAKLIWN